jgi:uncharacterized protein (DUF433 family)
MNYTKLGVFKIILKAEKISQYNESNVSILKSVEVFKEIKIMNLVLERETPPFREDESGAIRIGNTRVLLELVIRAFQDGASPESIVQRYSTLSLSDAYTTIGYYLRHQQEIETYLSQREQLAESVRQKLSNSQPDLTLIRSRLLAQQTP